LAGSSLQRGAVVACPSERGQIDFVRISSPKKQTHSLHQNIGEQSCFILIDHMIVFNLMSRYGAAQSLSPLLRGLVKSCLDCCAANFGVAVREGTSAGRAPARPAIPAKVRMTVGASRNGPARGASRSGAPIRADAQASYLIPQFQTLGRCSILDHGITKCGSLPKILIITSHRLAGPMLNALEYLGYLFMYEPGPSSCLGTDTAV
jgi:hypothetical protein